MLTKKEFKTLWTITKCLAPVCEECKAGEKHTPKHIKDKFFKLSGESAMSYCTMTGWLQGQNWTMEQAYSFLFRPLKFEDI